MQYNKKGTALVYALMIIAMASFILLGMVRLVASRVGFVSDVVYREKAFQIAESCINEYRWYLAHNTDGKTIEEVLDFWKGTSSVGIPRGISTFTWNTQTSAHTAFGKCSITLTDYPKINTTTPVIAVVKGWPIGMANKTRTIKVRFRRTSWSDYVILTNKASKFDTGWNINGKVMSNDGIEFDGVISNRIYAAVNQYDVAGVGTKPGVWSVNALQNGCEYNTVQNSCVFLGGKRYPVPKKDFEGIIVDFNAMKNAAQRPSGTTVNGCNYSGTNNCYFANSGQAGRYLTFRADGKFDIVNVKDFNSSSFAIKNTVGATSTYSIPDEGIIYVDDNVWVTGTIDSHRVTVVAGKNNGTVNGDVYVGMGDLKYVNKNGQEVLGIIANGSVNYIVDKKICTGSCNTDLNLEIDAAMVARDGSVGKPGFNENCCGGGCALKKNRIDVYGSIVSNEFIQFADSKDCPGKGIKDIGFNIKNVVYDNYLYADPPPFFPSDVYYTVDSWEEL